MERIVVYSIVCSSMAAIQYAMHCSFVSWILIEIRPRSNTEKKNQRKCWKSNRPTNDAQLDWLFTCMHFPCTYQIESHRFRNRHSTTFAALLFTYIVQSHTFCNKFLLSFPIKIGLASACKKSCQFISDRFIHSIKPSSIFFEAIIFAKRDQNAYILYIGT